MEDQTASTGQYRDFYGIHVPGNWGNSFYKMDPIPEDDDIPTHIQYFRAMSEAMAKSCSGEVVLFTQTPGDYSRYGNRLNPNIWWQKEKPALQALWEKGVVDKFIIADYNEINSPGGPRLWRADLRIGTLARMPVSELQSKRDLENETEEEALLRRQFCDSNGLAQRIPGGDPFADPYQQFF